MKRWKLKAIWALGVFLLLIGVSGLAHTQTVGLRPFSWADYWQGTWDLWVSGTLFTVIGYALWRLTTKALRASLNQVNMPKK